MAFVEELEPPYVIKADGIAAGKGVVIAGDRAGARVALEACLVQRAFGDAGLERLALSAGFSEVGPLHSVRVAGHPRIIGRLVA